MNHRYEAKLHWSRDDAAFVDNRYSRRHEWSFDGGVTVPASSSPGVVPLPYSVEEAVDPEEALVASAASCHMLWFLSHAARRGFVVDDYQDEPFGTMEKNEAGKLAFTSITLRPRIRFSREKQPSAEELQALHHDAHADCFIANSLRCDVGLEAQPRSLRKTR